MRKLRRRQRNRAYSMKMVRAEQYFEEMKRKWESQNGQSQASSNRQPQDRQI